MLFVAPLAPADADAAVALMLHPRVRGPLFPQPPRVTPAALLGRPYFVARLQRDGPLVALLGLHAEGLSFAVDPGLWGCGVGRALLKSACQTLAPAAGLSQLHALVQRDNVRSRRLLERTGFRFTAAHGPLRAGAAAVLRYEIQLPLPARRAATGLPNNRESCHGTRMDRRQEAGPGQGRAA